MPRKTPAPHERKFTNFLRLVTEAKASGAEVVLIHHPSVLGDSYAELIMSLDRLAQAELALRILPPNERRALDLK
jgi:hypothetical protein